MAAKVKHADGREGEVLESNSKQSLVLFCSVGPGQSHTKVFGDPVKKKNFTVQVKADRTIHFLSEWCDNESLTEVP